MSNFTLKNNHVIALPILHYSMEMATEVKKIFDEVQPDCVVVELPESLQKLCFHAASRLPDISVIKYHENQQHPLYFLFEPCDPICEALRSAIEKDIPTYCIDLDVTHYPDHFEPFPDPYAINTIGLKKYYEAYESQCLQNRTNASTLDNNRELYMAKRLKELSYSFDKILFIGGMFHITSILKSMDRNQFPKFNHADRKESELCALTEESCREVMAEFGWMTLQYEIARKSNNLQVDRYEALIKLYKKASVNYTEQTKNEFPGYHFANLIKFARNYALITGRLTPSLYQILSAAKCCVDHNFAYEVWLIATDYPLRKNIDQLPELNLSIDEVWGPSKYFKFHLKEKNPKSLIPKQLRNKLSDQRFFPLNPFGICSYPPEDAIIEAFGEYLRNKGFQRLSEEGSKSMPFSTSLEDGIDTRETIRHWPEHKLYVKVNGKPPGRVGSIVVIFDEDESKQLETQEKYPWKMTWLGEHSQESDMALYATQATKNIVGPGISRCEYGGLMLTHPPRRLFDIWSDPDYQDCRTKSEVLLMAAIDYSVQTAILFVAAKPPRNFFKSYARRFGKKIIYLPIAQISSAKRNKIRIFHVLDGYHRREIAGDFIV